MIAISISRQKNGRQKNGRQKKWLALAVTGLLKSALFGLNPAEPITFAVVSLLLILVALVACYLPARRATKVDPMIVLRRE